MNAFNVPRELNSYICKYLDPASLAVLRVTCVEFSCLPRRDTKRKWLLTVEAAREGYLDILKWARKNGCDWNSLVCTHAAKHGRFEMLKWARENGCEWDERVCSDAAEGG